MENKTVNEQEFRLLVKKMLKEFAKDKSVDALDVEMNSMDCLEGEDEILLGADENKVPSGKTPKEVEMNKNDSKLGKIIKKAIQESNINLGTKSNKVATPSKPKAVDMNSKDTNAKAASDALVSVKATSATHKGESTKGMHKADFTSKDSKKIDIDVEMDQNDKEIDDNAPKVFVDAGAAGKDGQKKPKIYDKAQNEKDKEPIAKGIQLPEGFEKQKYTQKELFNFIISEAKKLV